MWIPDDHRFTLVRHTDGSDIFNIALFSHFRDARFDGIEYLDRILLVPTLLRNDWINVNGMFKQLLGVLRFKNAELDGASAGVNHAD